VSDAHGRVVFHPLGQIARDDDLHFDTQDGRAIIFYGYTDNRTNDPSIVVAPAVETNVLTLYYVP
jgi:hypothetical protein